ncbi:MAG: RIP metalloprotease RseP [Verrucomicrobiales bacterium]
METIINILEFLWVLLQVILIFNFLILVHEWGHFLAARWRGLHVEKFQIWFGPAIWKKTYNGVQYGIGCIPAGGFVALPQMAPMEMLEGKTDGEKPLAPISPLDKIIVAFAGPLFSFGLACVFALVVWGVKKPMTEPATSSVIGYIAPEMPAAQSGLKIGDRITAIDGSPVSVFAAPVDSVIERIVFSEGDTIEVTVERDGEEKPLTFSVGFQKEERTGIFNRSDTRKIGIGPAFTPLVEQLIPGSPAEQAGIQEGDIIRQLNSEKVYTLGQIVDWVKENPTGEAAITVERGGKLLPDVFTMTPAKPVYPEKADPVLGMVWGEVTTLERPNPIGEIKQSSTALFRMLSALFSKKSDIDVSHMSGPLMIGKSYFQMLKGEDGWRMALWFSILLNVNLAILNLMPLPVLDGGHITMALIEGVTRRPVRFRVLEYIQAGAALALIGLMLYISVLDGKGIAKDASEPEPEAKVPPTEYRFK